MKAKMLIACAIVSAAPFTSAFAQNAQPSGPQGTGAYGLPNMATPVPQNASGPYIPGTAQIDPRAATPGTATSGYVPYAARDDRRETGRGRWVYQGFSADTNPPAPTY